MNEILIEFYQNNRFLSIRPKETVHKNDIFLTTLDSIFGRERRSCRYKANMYDTRSIRSHRDAVSLIVIQNHWRSNAMCSRKGLLLVKKSKLLSEKNHQRTYVEITYSIFPVPYVYNLINDRMEVTIINSGSWDHNVEEFLFSPFYVSLVVYYLNELHIWWYLIQSTTSFWEIESGNMWDF